MATSGRMTGNAVTIGVSVNNNYFFIDWSLASQNLSGNTSTLDWWVYFHYTSSDAQLDNGDATVGNLVWDVPGRVYNFASNFTTRDMLLESGQTTVNHATNGTCTITVSGSIGGSFGGTSGGSTTFDLPTIDRTPTTPTLTQGSGTARSASGTSYSATATGGVNNSGPTVTYTLQSATTSDFSGTVTNHGTSTTSGATLSTTSALTASATYYFRIRASNTAGTKYSSIFVSYGIPTSPTSVLATPSTNSIDRIVLTWLAPTGYVGSGITGYEITRSGTPANTFNVGNVLTYTDTDSTLVPGNSYTYTVKTKTSISTGSPAYLSAASTASASKVAPGPPFAPSAAPVISKIGRNVTVTSSAVSGNGGIAIDTGNANQGYFVQYQTATTQAGTYSSWSTPVKMSDQSNRVHTFSLMNPALWYKFRVYAANPVIYASNGTTQAYYPHNNSAYTAEFSSLSTPLFVSAGGRRYRGTGEANAGTFQPTETAKRVSGIGNITAATGNGTTITYTAANTLSVGDKIVITGLGIASGSSLNLSNVTVATATSSQFTVTNSTVGVSSGTGLAVCWKDLTVSKRYNGTSWIDLT